VSEQMRLLKTHRSLFHFKQKFQPCWESRYIVISSTLALPRTALALLRVHQSAGQPGLTGLFVDLHCADIRAKRQDVRRRLEEDGGQLSHHESS